MCVDGISAWRGWAYAVACSLEQLEENGDAAQREKETGYAISKLYVSLCGECPTATGDEPELQPCLLADGKPRDDTRPTAFLSFATRILNDIDQPDVHPLPSAGLMAMDGDDDFCPGFRSELARPAGSRSIHRPLRIPTAWPQSRH